MFYSYDVMLSVQAVFYSYDVTLSVQAMFYSYDVLNQRTGKLTVVWLVANGALKYSRRQDKHFRDVMAVNIPRSWLVGHI